MKKKLLSLALALAVCLSLSVPASASIWVESAPDTDVGYYDQVVGSGWSYDSSGDVPVLKFNGVKGLECILEGPCLIELAPGSKSTLSFHLLVEAEAGDPSTFPITFKGSGELEIYSQNEHGALWGDISEVIFQDGLAATGGANAGDSMPLTLSPVLKDPDAGWGYRTLQANGVPAKYVHIGPAAGTSASGGSGFPDVAASSAFAPAIGWAVEQGIAAGYGDGTFRPGNTCTVSHILTFLWRANGRPGAGSDERAAVTAWAKGLGIDIDGLSAPCTRSMAVTYLWKAAGSPAPSKAAAFADVPAGADYAAAVSWALEKGITNGTGGNTFSPGGTCTRGQIVTFLYRQGA